MIAFATFYLLCCICFVFPPSAFVSVGLTIPVLFGQWLGSENVMFLQYHLKRTCASIIAHSALPLGFFVGVCIVEGLESLALLLVTTVGFMVFQAAILCFIAGATLAYYWSCNNWSNHPIVLELKTYSRNLPWTDVAAEINSEYRRIDKVSISTNPVTKTVITSTWVVKVLPYWLRVAKQSHVLCILEEQDEHHLSLQSPGGTQYLTVKVQFVGEVNGHTLKPFTFRLNASDYNTVQDRLQRPVANVRGLVIHQNIESRFVLAFTEEVKKNPIYTATEELDACLGCMTSRANVRLIRRCDLSGSEGISCSPCFCRPMWCVSCLAKWFAARQDQDHPEQWLASRSPCPTCRSPFCLLDVSLVELEN